MALIRKVRGHEPVIGENTFLAETAVILGDVTIGRDCSIWYNAVLRGDVNRIVIGDRTNIQDGAVLHTIYDQAKHPSQTIIGNDVSVGHNATIHGAVIEDNCLIGMGATVLDNAVVASGCIVAAGALVLSGAKLEPDSVYAGVPARKVKEVTPEQREELWNASVKGMIPMGHAQQAEDIAWATVFMASDFAREITGECLSIDGGTTSGR